MLPILIFFLITAFSTPQYVQPGVARVADGVMAWTMNNMGPRYDYKLVGGTFYVDRGRGWERLQYWPDPD